MSQTGFAHRNLPQLLLGAREAAMGHFRPILKRYGLTDPQWRIVRALSQAEGPMEPGQIALTCSILSPSLTGILSRLSDMGLIDRRWSAQDQRRQVVRLTAKGEQLVAQMVPLIDEQYRRLEEAVGRERLATLYDTIDDALKWFSKPVANVMDDVRRPAMQATRSKLRALKTRPAQR
jgi:homoprotocatechuate degradation regulator HpaR